MRGTNHENRQGREKAVNRRDSCRRKRIKNESLDFKPYLTERNHAQAENPLG